MTTPCTWFTFNITERIFIFFSVLTRTVSFVIIIIISMTRLAQPTFRRWSFFTGWRISSTTWTSVSLTLFLFRPWWNISLTLWLMAPIFVIVIFFFSNWLVTSSSFTITFHSRTLAIHIDRLVVGKSSININLKRCTVIRINCSKSCWRIVI